MSTITIAAKDCRRALEQVLRAASTDPAGGVLRGVLVEASDALRFVAAPGPRLAIEADDAKSPIVVRTPGDHSYLAVVMPALVGTSRSRKR